MLSTNSWHTEDSIFSHSTLPLHHNSNIPFGAVSYPWSLLFRCAHRCSIGLRSGDCAGHVRTSISFSWNKALAFLHLCLGSLSCWKIMSTGFFLKYLILVRVAYISVMERAKKGPRKKHGKIVGKSHDRECRQIT